MTDATRNPYDQFPYQGCGIPATSPEALATLASFTGHTVPELDRAKVLEIGCGDGGNLIPLAFHHPDWTLVGIDPSRTAIETAEKGRIALDLQNLQFEHRDVRELTPDRRYDFVLCHGVYSWVDADVQHAILQLASQSLAPGGLFYVSYNTLPGWGMRSLVREHLLRSRAGEFSSDDPERRTRDAKEQLNTLSALIGETGGFPYLELLQREIRFASEQPSYHLAHEYLAEHNRAFWFGEVLEAAEAMGLHYVGDAQHYRREGMVPAHQRAFVKDHFTTVKDREEALDLARNRQLRASVFTAAAASTTALDRDALIRQSFLTTTLQPKEPEVDFTEGCPQTFSCTRTATDIQIDTALGKAALIVLGPTYPRGLGFEDLLKHAIGLLAHQQITTPPSEADLMDLVQGLQQLHENALIDVRMRQSRWTTPKTNELPRAHALARYEAQHRPYLTSAAHELFPIDNVDRLLIDHLDGTRRPEQLLELLRQESIEDAEARLERLIVLLVHWGFTTDGSRG